MLQLGPIINRKVKTTMKKQTTQRTLYQYRPAMLCAITLLLRIKQYLRFTKKGKLNLTVIDKIIGASFGIGLRKAGDIRKNKLEHEKWMTYRTKGLHFMPTLFREECKDAGIHFIDEKDSYSRRKMNEAEIKEREEWVEEIDFITLLSNYGMEISEFENLGETIQSVGTNEIKNRWWSYICKIMDSYPDMRYWMLLFKYFPSFKEDTEVIELMKYIPSMPINEVVKLAENIAGVKASKSMKELERTEKEFAWLKRYREESLDLRNNTVEEETSRDEIRRSMTLFELYIARHMEEFLSCVAKNPVRPEDLWLIYLLQFRTEGEKEFLFTERIRESASYAPIVFCYRVSAYEN